MPNVTYKHIPVEDVETSDLLHHFEPCIEYIHSGITQNQNVLIHCISGISRSVTLISAYLLSIALVANPSKSLSYIQSLSPSAQPNPGFESQLNIWHSMGSRGVDHGNRMYRAWLLTSVQSSIINQQHGNDYNDQTSTNLNILTKMPAVQSPHPLITTTSFTPSSPSSPSSPPPSILRCKRCRTQISTSSQTIPHAAGQGQSSFAYHKRSTTSSNSKMAVTGRIGIKVHNNDAGVRDETCNSFFVEPLGYLVGTASDPTRTDLDSDQHADSTTSTDNDDDGTNPPEMEGKITCPNSKCSHILGKWSWTGLPCSCGAWVSPAFMVHKKGIDVIKDISALLLQR